MHQCGWLESVIGSLSAHVRSCQTPKLIVDLRQNLIQRSIIPFPNIDQQLCQVFGFRTLHRRYFTAGCKASGEVAPYPSPDHQRHA